MEQRTEEVKSLYKFFTGDSKYPHTEEVLWKVQHGLQPIDEIMYHFYLDDEYKPGDELSTEFKFLQTHWMYNINSTELPNEYRCETFHIELPVEVDDKTRRSLYDRRWNPLSLTIMLDNKDDVGCCRLICSIDSIDDMDYSWIIRSISVETVMDIIREEIEKAESGFIYNGQSWLDGYVKDYNAEWLEP